MNVKVHSNDLGHIMKTISKCLGPKGTATSNIEIRHEDSLFTIRASNGSVSAMASTPLLGGDGEAFCVDGELFGKVVGLCSGAVDIRTEGKSCLIKSNGRTRIPIVEAVIPEAAGVEGKEVSVSGSDFARVFGKVGYAISTDQTRIVLTGVLIEVVNNVMLMTTLDGFQFSQEEIPCVGDGVKMVVPGSLMKLIAGSCSYDEKIILRTDVHRVTVETDGLLLNGPLLTGEFVDYKKLIPREFKAEVKVNTQELRNALKSSQVVNNSQKMVKLEVSPEVVKVLSNSDQADFEADVGCDGFGDGLKIAFDERYLTNALAAVDTDEAALMFTTAVSPAIVRGVGQSGIHLLLPVRIAAG